jgi:ABC-type Fe3+ transport system permease subunit
VLIIWTYRMAKNMQAMGRQGMSMSNPGATIAINILGGCTLGILNFLMWREVWQGSDPDSPPGDPGWKRRPIGSIVNLWFGLTIGGAVLGIIAAGVGGFGGAQFGNDSEKIAEQFRDQLPVTILSSVVSVATAVVFILLVQQLAARHMKTTGEAR